MEELINILLRLFIIFSGAIILIKLFLFIASKYYVHKLFLVKNYTIIDVSPDKLPPVSIVIPVYNEEKIIKKLFLALSNLIYPKSLLELIFIDDNSSDSTPELIKKYKESNTSYDIKYIRFTKRKKGGVGKSALLNYGLSIANNEILVFYDADTFMELYSLKNLILNLIQDHTIDVAMGVCVPLNKDENLLTYMSYLETLYYNWVLLPANCLLFGTVFPSGRNYAIRKKSVVNAGGWNENSVGEDYELGFRMSKNNKFRTKIIFDAQAQEIAPDTFKTWLVQRTRWNRANFDVTTDFFLNFWHFLKSKKWLGVLPNLPNYLCDSFFILSLYGLLLIIAFNPNFISWGIILFPTALLYILIYSLGYWIALKREKKTCLSSIFKIFVMWPIYQHMILVSIVKALCLKVAKGAMTKRGKTEKEIVHI